METDTTSVLTSSLPEALLDSNRGLDFKTRMNSCDGSVISARSVRSRAVSALSSSAWRLSTRFGLTVKRNKKKKPSKVKNNKPQTNLFRKKFKHLHPETRKTAPPQNVNSNGNGNAISRVFSNTLSRKTKGGRSKRQSTKRGDGGIRLSEIGTGSPKDNDLDEAPETVFDVLYTTNYGSYRSTPQVETYKSLRQNSHNSPAFEVLSGMGQKKKKMTMSTVNPRFNSDSKSRSSRARKKVVRKESLKKTTQFDVFTEEEFDPRKGSDMSFLFSPLDDDLEDDLKESNIKRHEKKMDL